MIEFIEGLEGVPAAKTTISDVRGEKGQLIYRGHWVEELVEKYSFEAVVYLVWNNRFPSADEEKEFSELLASKRALSDEMKQIIKLTHKHSTSNEVLRTVVSSLKVPGEKWPPTQEQAIEILAKAPTIVAYYYNLHEGNDCPEPDATLGHAANYLYMIQHKKPTEAIKSALEAYLILSIDHGMNASTFTARVITSTQADIVCAVTVNVIYLQ